MEARLEHSEEQAKGRFELISGDDVLATMTYSRIDANNIIIDHTASNPAFKGTGAGKEIVHRMAQWARENDHKVLPLCPFTKGVMDKDPSLNDVRR